MVMCANGHEVDAQSVECPICGARPVANDSQVISVATAAAGTATTVRVDSERRSALYGLSPIARPSQKTRQPPSNVADGMFVAAGVLILVSAFAEWIIATGPVGHAWNALHVGDDWTPANRVSSLTLFGPFVVLLGAAYICLGLARFSTHYRIPKVRARAILAIVGAFIGLIVMLQVVGTSASFFDYRTFWNQVDGQGEIAHYGPGMWIYIGGLLMGVIGGIWFLATQRRSAGAAAAR